MFTLLYLHHLNSAYYARKGSLAFSRNYPQINEVRKSAHTVVTYPEMEMHHAALFVVPTIVNVDSKLTFINTNPSTWLTVGQSFVLHQ